MPAPLLDSAGWFEVERTAVSLQSIRAAADAHRPPNASPESWYQTVAKRARRDNWPVGRTVSVQIARETRKAEAMATATAAGTVAQAVSSPVQSTPTAVQIIDAQIQAGGNPKILSLIEKREYLASIVRTPIGEVNEKSPLAQKVKRYTRTDKHGETTQSEEIELPGKIRALELDARLAGEIDGDKGGGRVMINIGILNE